MSAKTEAPAEGRTGSPSDTQPARCACGGPVRLSNFIDVHGDGSFEVYVISCRACRDSQVMRAVRVEGDRYRTLGPDEPNPR